MKNCLAELSAEPLSFNICRYKFHFQRNIPSPKVRRHIAYCSLKQLPRGNWKLKSDNNVFLLWFSLDTREYIGDIDCPMIFARQEKCSIVPRDKEEEIVRLCSKGKLVEIKKLIIMYF